MKTSLFLASEAARSKPTSDYVYCRPEYRATGTAVLRQSPRVRRPVGRRGTCEIIRQPEYGNGRHSANLKCKFLFVRPLE